jgi:hypothetical protein
VLYVTVGLFTEHPVKLFAGQVDEQFAFAVNGLTLLTVPGAPVGHAEQAAAVVLVNVLSDV